jgi:protein-arginine deiminase
MQERWKQITEPKFLLLSSLEYVEEVFVLETPRTKAFVASLAQIIPQTGAKLTPIPFEAYPLDVWMQDTVEIGRNVVWKDGNLQQEPAILCGLRGKHTPENPYHTALDSHIQNYFAERKAHLIHAGEPREGTRWIDWFGNLEVSPPVTDSFGNAFPFGRVLVGAQGDLGIHPEVLAFLEAQGLQTPPIVVDTSWLVIGHVDEVVNFTPSSSSVGFKVLLPSPTTARRILERAVAQGKGDALCFAGTAEECTIETLLHRVANSEENRAIDTKIAETQSLLCKELGITEADFVLLPALFKEGASLIPNPVNCLVCNGHLIIPHPNGAILDGEDCFVHAMRSLLAPLPLHFVAVWESYHVLLGEIHCGTNALRHFEL